MKRLLIGFAATIVSTTSLAVVVDKFRCHLEVMDLETKNKSTADNDFFVARLPVGVVKTEDYDKFEAKSYISTDIETASATYGVGINLNYKHAIRWPEKNKPNQSRQSSCISISTSYCDQEEGQKGRGCYSTALACLEDGLGPFDENSSWSDVPLIDGIPMFNSADLREMSGVLTDKNGVPVAEAKVNCSHLGTFK